jgi:hypothetical protein
MTVGSWIQRAVPFTVEGMPLEAEGRHLRGGQAHSVGIVAPIDLGSDAEARPERLVPQEPDFAAGGRRALGRECAKRLGTSKRTVDLWPECYLSGCKVHVGNLRCDVYLRPSTSICSRIAELSG